MTPQEMVELMKQDEGSQGEKFFYDHYTFYEKNGRYYELYNAYTLKGHYTPKRISKAVYEYRTKRQAELKGEKK